MRASFGVVQAVMQNSSQQEKSTPCPGDLLTSRETSPRAISMKKLAPVRVIFKSADELGRVSGLHERSQSYVAQAP